MELSKKVALLLLLLLALPASAHQLTITRAWTATEYQCSQLRVTGSSTTGTVTATCESVLYYHDPDFIRQSGFDERPYGYWSYTTNYGSQGNCALAAIDVRSTEVVLICH